MRKFLFGLIIMILCIDVYALNHIYSDWSSEYPKDILDILVEKEDRFKFYREKVVSESYLKYDSKSDLKYDFNHYKLGEMFECSESDSTKEHIFFEKINQTLFFEITDIDSFSFIRKFDGEVYISEIEFYYNGNKIQYDTKYSFLNDGDTDKYIKIEDDYFIKFYEKLDGKNLSMKIYLKSNDTFKNPFSFKFLAESKFALYDYYIYFNSEGREKILKYDVKSLTGNFRHENIKYGCRDKLYRVNNVIREYAEDYYVNLDGYIKDESTKKTYYRYIMNDYVILNSQGKVVYDESYCIKEYCLLYYINEEENVVNPKTGDNYFKYFILLIMSFVVIRIIYLVLSKRFKKEP